MRNLFISILLLTLAASPACADPRQDVLDLLRSGLDSIVVLLRDDSLDKPSRNARILDIVAPIFDYDTMAKLTLGKKHWPRLNTEQQQTFSTLFVEKMQNSYLDKLDIYSDEKIRFGEPQGDDRKMQVPTTLVAKDSSVEILYKLYLQGTAWKVYDVEIGGVSIVQTYRSQFDGVLSDGSVEELLQKLKEDGNFTTAAPGVVGG